MLMAMAVRHDKIRITKRKRLYLGKMKRVLTMERLWLKEVRYQFAYAIREQAFSAMKVHVKYSHVRRLLRFNRYVALIKELSKLVEITRMRQAEATIYQQDRQKGLLLQVFRSYAHHS